MFGRPLFGSLYAFGKLEKNSILQLAADKLLGERGLALVESLRSAALAILSVRMMLEYDRTRSSSLVLEEDLVEQHLRVAYTVPEHLEHMYSGYPSEPILVEAAGRLMVHPSLRGKLLPHLSEVSKSGLIKNGERGELAHRILFVLAYQDATLSIRPPWISDLKFHRPVKVLDFFKCLFSDLVYDKILHAKPTNKVVGPEFGEEFKDVYMFASHYVKAFDDSMLCPNGLLAAFSRGYGVQCWDNQPDIDQFTACAKVANMNEALRADNMPLIMWQNKFYEFDTAPFNLPDSVCKILKKNGHKSSLCYIQQDFGSVNDGIEVSPSPTRQSDRIVHEDDPLLYAFHVQGSNSAVYRAFEDSQVLGVFRDILRQGNIFESHSRWAMLANRISTIRLKPGIWKSEYCYPWSDSAMAPRNTGHSWVKNQFDVPSVSFTST